MAAAQVGALLHQIHRLAAPAGPGPGADRELLEAFAACRDEAAFAALVGRHGPMVLRVCRRVLGNHHDAEDAFQATFLVLAEHSRSIRKREALGGWLHGVAYRTAMKAKRSAARRRQHEARRTPPAPQPAAGPTWDEVQAALDEEVQRLPERVRSAFVLHVLVGKSGPQVAAELGCKEGTVYSRLNQARQLLRRRLVRRGIELSALLAALAVADGAGRAVVPAALAKGAIRYGLLVAAGGAAAGTIPAHVAGLAAGVTRAMFVNKVKIAVVVLLAAGLLAGGGAWAHRALAEPEAGTKADASRQADVKPRAAGEKAGPVAVRGRVLDPDGKPVPGARLIFVYASSRKYPERAWATSAADGRFEFAVARALLDDPWYENNRDQTYVVAAADGYGCTMAPLPPGVAGDVTLRPVKDDVPIRGRILDLEGRPVAGATVRVDAAVYFPKAGDLTPWLDALKAGKADADLAHLTALWSPAYAALIPSVTTGADGTFMIRGVGRERLVRFRIDGPTLATRQIKAMTRPGGTMRLPDGTNSAGEHGLTYCGATFDLVISPTKPVVGTVRDKATGKPLAGVTVATRFIGGMDGFQRGLIRVTTDKDGRYSLVGLPKGLGNQITADASDMPYVPAAKSVPDTPGLGPATVDFALRRGVWVKGRVTDRATGKPVAAGVEYYSLLDNPHLKGVRLEDPNWHATGDDGTFRTVALPGPGIIAVRSTYDRYRMGVGADRIKGHRVEGGFELLRTAPDLIHPGNYHVIEPINPEPGAKSITCDVVLDPGRTLRGVVIGQDGRPLEGARLNGEKPMTYWARDALKGAEFSILSLGGDESRLVQVMHEGKRLAGWRTVRGSDQGQVRIQLAPWGSVIGRLVRPDGEPMTNVSVDVGHDLRVRAAKDGRFRVDGLARGLKYSVTVVKDPGYVLESSGKDLKDFTIEPGETRDLGDIRVKPME